MKAKTFKVEKSFARLPSKEIPSEQITEKAAAVMKMFGLDKGRFRNPEPVVKCRFEIREGDVCYITGASGAGKSVLLEELYRAVEDDEKIKLDDIELPEEGTLVDCIGDDLLGSLRTFSKAGLSDVFCMLNRPVCLSDGQKYRFRLAKALASGKKIIFADEFCSNLDRITAAVIAYNVREFADRHKTIFILAGSHDDILADLVPDVMVINYLAGQTRVIYRDIRRQA
jgi:ABC-type ATPase with predicted acetyltransferase domain